MKSEIKQKVEMLETERNILTERLKKTLTDSFSQKDLSTI